MKARGLVGMIIAAQLLISGCAAPPAATAVPTVITPASPIPTETVLRPTITPTDLATATAAPLPSATAEPAPFTVCSPLEGIALGELGQPDLLKNPFDMPRPGMDDGHHGADFAYWTRGERTTMQGLPVYAVLPGRIAGVIQDRPPYGNAIIVETALRDLPEEFLQPLEIPAPQPTVQAPVLTCPQDMQDYDGSGERSLYLLYAHLDQTPVLNVGDAVACGGRLGEVGTTGKSVNYHLHLEARVGPAGSVFESMTHDNNAATLEEMAVYCTWRVSGLFQLLDPMTLFP